MKKMGKASSPVPFKDRPFGKAIAEYCESKSAVIAFFVVLVFVLAALFASLISPQNPYDLATLDLLDGTLAAAMSKSFSGSTYHARHGRAGQGHALGHSLWLAD